MTAARQDAEFSALTVAICWGDQGATVTFTALLTLFSDAVTVAIVEAVAPVAVAVTDMKVVPAGIVIVAGTGRKAELLVRATDVPPAGAGDVNDALNVAVWPLCTDVTEETRLDNTGVLTVRAAVLEIAPRVAVSVSAVSAVTAAGTKL